MSGQPRDLLMRKPSDEAPGGHAAREYDAELGLREAAAESQDKAPRGPCVARAPGP
jgi:hypothetical protein